VAGQGKARRSQNGASSNSVFTGTPSARAILTRFRNDGFRRAAAEVRAMHPGLFRQFLLGPLFRMSQLAYPHGQFPDDLVLGFQTAMMGA